MADMQPTDPHAGSFDQRHASAAAPKAEGFWLSNYCIIPVAVCGGLVAYRASLAPANFVFSVLPVLPVIFVSLLVAYVCHKLFRNSRRAASIAFCVSSSLPILGAVLTVFTAVAAKENTQALQSFAAKAGQIGQDARRDYESTGEVDASRTESLLGAMRDAAGSMTGEQAAAMQAVADVTQRYADAGIAHEQTLSSVTQLPGPETAQLPAELDVHIVKVREARDVNLKLDELTSALPKDLDAVLTERGVSEPFRKAVVADAFPPAQLNRLHALRLVQGEILENLESLTALFRTEWGRWSVSPTTQEYIFQNPAAKDNYAKYIGTLGELAQREDRLRRAILGVKSGKPLPSNPDLDGDAVAETGETSTGAPRW